MIKITLDHISFDINQSEFNITKQSSPKTYRLANGGEVIIPTTDKLDIIEFSGYFYNNSNYLSLVDMMSSGLPVRFTVTGLNIPVNFFVIIESLLTTERGGDSFCIEYALKLKEYVSQKAKIISSTSNNLDIEPFETLVVPQYYIVKQGDTLWDISKRFLGDATRYMEIFNLNENIKNPNLIYIGQEIRIL